MREFMHLTTGAGKRVMVRKSEVTDIMEETDSTMHKYAPETKAILTMKNGAIVIVREEYDYLEQQMKEH